MVNSFKILLLEDLQEDYELVKREIGKNYNNFEILHVDNESDFRKQLVEFSPDLVLSDYNLPQINGLEALQIVREMHSNLPFLVVTGSINEDTAVDCIKAGATDYIIKENLIRLNPAIKSALQHSKILKGKEAAEDALAESERKFRHSFNHANIGQALIDLKGKVLEINPKFIEILKLDENKLDAIKIIDFVFEDDKALLQQKFDEAVRGKYSNIAFEIRFINSENLVRWGNVVFSLVHQKNEPLYFVMHVQDISPRIEAYEKIRKLSLAVEQSPVSIIITDIKGTIEYTNRRFSDVTQFESDEIIGKSPKILKSGFQDQLFYKKLWETINSGETWRGEMCNKKKGGDLYWENVVISPIKNDQNKISHFLAIKEDISEKKKMIDELIVAKEKAEESDRIKSAFLASMSHEIRTPLNAIVGFSSLIAENANDPKLDNFSKIIGTQNDLLLHMINDIIEFAKMESEAMEINKEVFDINKLLNDLFIMFESKCNADVELISKVQTDSLMIYTDKFKMTQIFSNLISNAIKFTEEGRITFGFDLYENSKLRFFVRDTGIGISDKQKENIFKRFTKVDSFSQGVGLGLSIVKNIVEFLDGKVWFESEVGVGSTFYFELPAVLDSTHGKDSNEKVKLQSYKKTNFLWKGTILIAEDNDSNFLFIKELFLDKDIQILHAENGQEAIEMCRTNREIDLVLIDIKMPIVDGLEATRQIKKLRPNLPVIAQTAFASANDKIKAKEFGCDDYISKPINKNELFEIIGRYLV